jgi:hypothetical protein
MQLNRLSGQVHELVPPAIFVAGDLKAGPGTARPLTAITRPIQFSPDLFRGMSHAVFVGMVLRGLFVCHVRMMRRLFVVAGFVVGRGFAVMFGCGFVMMGSQMMMFNSFVCHGFVSGLKPL